LDQSRVTQIGAALVVALLVVMAAAIAFAIAASTVDSVDELRRSNVFVESRRGNLWP
jgi:type II secretory pathway component PulK